MSRRDSTYFSEGQQPGGAQDGFDSSDDGLGSSMHLSPSFVRPLHLERVFCYLYADIRLLINAFAGLPIDGGLCPRG